MNTNEPKKPEQIELGEIKVSGTAEVSWPKEQEHGSTDVTSTEKRES
jgi:hypothetical protein